MLEMVFSRELPVGHPFLLGRRKEPSGVLSLMGFLEQSISCKSCNLVEILQYKTAIITG